MPFYFSWGKTFLEIYDEFSTKQIEQIRMRAEDLFERRPCVDDPKGAARISPSIIPFEIYGYGLALVLSANVWSLEVATFPPHAEPGQRILKARRERERRERRQMREAAKKANRRKKGRAGSNRLAERMISTAKNADFGILSILYNIFAEARVKVEQPRRKLASFLKHIFVVSCGSPAKVRDDIFRWLLPSVEECRAANVAAWMQDRLPRGFQWERRLFFASFMPIWLDTIVPIEGLFVRSGRSIFGERFLESEYAP